MQRKKAEQLIRETRPLVGSVIELQRLDRAHDRYETRRCRILANDEIVNLKPPDEPRLCLDVYARAEDLETGETLHLSVEKLRKQRTDATTAERS